ncbi:LysR family transcriptional regulator [Ramlibacter tataouinensis]|uniref:LysR family transcriptional regulator n=1 Tax=Ramlibacter tataouinensis TaxID=94132 RepID=A0A127JXC5_9BURK|nr:LysR family transcriptional regulator [Ramlibacter tataouinensis]
MNTPFDWNLVRSFLAALDHGSLLGAARVLGASQPTLGRHIEALEAQLGAVLFERTGRGLVPTATALRLAESARQMESGAEQLARQLASADADETGTVRISASQPLACFLLPAVLSQMRLALPQVQVELVASDAVSNLLRRDADIALRMVPPEQASLVARRIGKVTLGAYAHRDYLARHGKPRELADLLQHDVIAGDRNEDVLFGYRQSGLTVGKEAFSLRSDDLVVQWQAVRAGLGVGFIADFVAATDANVLPVLPLLKIPPIPMWLVVHREIRSNRRIRAVYDFLARSVPRAL